MEVSNINFSKTFDMSLNLNFCGGDLNDLPIFVIGTYFVEGKIVKCYKHYLRSNDEDGILQS